jgi:hypothetical protein
VKRLIPLVALGLLLIAAPAANAAVDLSGGQTRLTLAKGTVKALTGLGVKVSTTGPAAAQGRHVKFPITGGAIDPATAAGVIRHKGGIRLAAGGTRVVLKNFDVKVGGRITLSAQVGKGRVKILNLVGKPKVTRSGFGTNVRGLTAELNRTAARTLNTVFGVKAFAAGLPLGKVVVKAEPSQTELAAKGQTALALDAGTLSALASLGVTPGIIGPATLSGTTASFPITGGKAELDFSAGSITHSGGISLTAGATVVNLTDFDIVIGTGVRLLATVNGAPGKVPIADLSLGNAPQVSGRTITVSGVTAKLSAEAAAALNTAFGTTALAAGLPLGTATVTATGK